MISPISWFASVICVVFTLRCASAFARKEPGLFLALMVHAAVWGVLVVYYGTPRELRNELLPALSSYLAAVASFFIYRRRTKPHAVDFSEEVVTWFLLLIALPKVIYVPTIGRELMPGISEKDIQVLVTLVLGTIAAITMYKAIEVSIPTRTTRLLIATPLFLYWFVAVLFVSTWARDLFRGNKPGMNDLFEALFAFLKVATVVTFIPAVLMPYEPFSSMGWKERVKGFLRKHVEPPQTEMGGHDELL